MAQSKFCLYVDVTGSVNRVAFTDESCSAIIRGGVNGYFDCTPLSSTLSLWTHESGKIERLAENLTGTRLWATAYGPTDIIVGPIVLTGGNTPDGEVDGLTDTQIEEITGVASAALREILLKN
jgi:hypothetical protein